MSQTKSKNSIDLVFSNIIKNKPCVYIWRVEGTHLMPVSKDFYGVFFKKDSYLIYSCLESNTTKSISQHIHLWIGSESSNEDQGVGAFKMIELDEYLNNAPIQHRECQNYETERFLSYFKNQGGIKYLNGGWQSGDHYYEKEFRNRLFRVKGKRLIRLNELRSIEWSSLNRNDSFLIDLNSVIFIWNGRNTNKLDRLQLLNKVKFLKNDREINTVIVEDGEEKELSKEELKAFELYFPLKDKLKKLKNDSVNDTLDDFRFEHDVTPCLKLYKCSYGQDDEDEMIKIKIIEQKAAPLIREDLTSEDSFIIDNGRLGIYVWSGRKCNVKERQEAMRNALGFLQAKGYEEREQNAIKVTCINEGYEPSEFRALFARWTESKYSVSSNYSSTKSLQVKFEANVLSLNPQLAAELQMLDDGSGSKKIWILKNTDIYLLDDNKYGQFHSQCCYVIEYKYGVNGVDNYIILYWIGRKSSIETQVLAHSKAIEFEKKITDTNVCHVVRVFEEKETKQFMTMFKGRIIIFQDNTDDLLDLLKVESCMLQVKYYGHLNTKAIQVELKPTSLNSNNVFIVCLNPTYYVWCGKASTGDERETAKSIIFSLKKEPEIVIESQEKDEFWNAIGGQHVCQNEKRTPILSQSVQSARFFEIFNQNGKVLAQEIFDFSQEDLNINEIMFLDTYEAIYVWIGSGANKKDVDDLDKILKEYFKNDPCQRQSDTPVIRIRQGYEPVYFTGFFNSGWNGNLFEVGLTYKELKLELHSQNNPEFFQLVLQQSSKTNEMKKKNPLDDFNNYPKYSYDELIRSADELPENVNKTLKELYLKESDFIKIFNMTFDEFNQKPSWKQKELKRSAHLF